MPEVTIGEGGSGGAIQQYLIAQNYPGILDAIAPAAAVPRCRVDLAGNRRLPAAGQLLRHRTGSALSPRTASGRSTVTSQGSTCTFWEETFVPVVDPSRCGFGIGPAASSLRSPVLRTVCPPCPPVRPTTPRPIPRACVAPSRIPTRRCSHSTRGTGFRRAPDRQRGCAVRAGRAQRGRTSLPMSSCR